MEYIKKKHVIDATWFMPVYSDPLNVLTELRERLEELPTVDAEPVIHGKWIHTGRSNIYGGTELECDQCHDKVMVQHPEDERFCRHCGAKMDGETDDTD